MKRKLMALCVCVHWACILVCLHVCVFMFENNATGGPWIQPEASLLSLLSHWLNGLMKCSVIQSRERILTTTMKPNHKGLNWSRECVHEKEREHEGCQLKVIIFVDPARASIHFIFLYSKDVSVCLCVYGLLPCLMTSGSKSINQPSYCTPTAQMVALGFLLIQFTAVFYPQTPHTPKTQHSHACHSHELLFQREQNNQHTNVWQHVARGAFKRQVIGCFLYELSLSSKK